MAVLVLAAVPAGGVHAEILRSVQIEVAHLVIADHIRPDLVAVHRVGKVDHIGGVAAGGAHIDLQRDVIALFANPVYLNKSSRLSVIGSSK